MYNPKQCQAQKEKLHSCCLNFCCYCCCGGSGICTENLNSEENSFSSLKLTAGKESRDT